MLVKIGEHWICPYAVACISPSKGHDALSERKPIHVWVLGRNYPINVSQEEADALIKEINAPLAWTNTVAASTTGGGK